MGENMQEQTLETVVDTLANKPGGVALKDGTHVEVYKVKMRHMPFMIGFVQRLVSELGIDDKGNVSISFTTPAEVLQLISKLPEEVAEAAALLTNLKREEFEDLDLAEAITVVSKVIEVNRAFFMEEVLPKFGSMLDLAKVGTAK